MGGVVRDGKPGCAVSFGVIVAVSIAYQVGHLIGTAYVVLTQ